VDALFGTGLKKALPAECGDVASALLNYPRVKLRVCAVDVPSGICSDSGSPLELDHPTNCFVHADLTVTFQTMKLGHLLSMGPVASRKVVVGDIGIGRWLAQFWTRDGLSADITRVAKPSLSSLLKRATNHKYSHGHAFILSGPSGRGGAARLAARGALRIGAGVVTVGCPGAALVENAARLDAVMLRVVEDGAALETVLEDQRIGVVCLGPGLGTVGLRTLWGMGEGARLACVEAQAVSWRLLQANVGVNGLGGRVESRHGDLRETEFGRKFPLITGSPPYFPPGTGVLPVDSQKAHARFELRGDVRDYAVAAARQLEVGGWFVLCFPTPQKARALEGIAAAGLRTVRRRDVIPRESLGALFTLFACRHAADAEGEGEEEEAPLTVRERSGRLTAEMAAVRRGFGFADGPAHGGHGEVGADY
jgi:tRNA1(Val) A37 N6-methylase TrmN6